MDAGFVKDSCRGCRARAQSGCWRFEILRGAKTRPVVFAGMLAVLWAGFGRSARLSAQESPALEVTTTEFPLGQVGMAYSASLTAANGTEPYTWSLAAGSLPPGLALAGNTIAGTPTQAGKFEFEVAVADSSSPQQTADRRLKIKVKPGSNGNDSQFNVTTHELPKGTVGAPYSASLAAANGTEPYTWSLAAGSLPPGLTLAGNTISGAPTQTGMFSFQVQATDSSSPAQTATRGLTLKVKPAPGASRPLEVAMDDLPRGKVGAAYSASLVARHGTEPYMWSVTAGSLPPGLALAGNTISGTPTQAGKFKFGLTVTDSSSPIQSASRNLGIAVQPGDPVVCSGTPLSESPMNATGLFSSVGAGLTIRKVTSGDPHMLSGHDIPAYSFAVNRILYNNPDANVKVIASPDGKNAQAISGENAQDGFFSGDGNLVYYAKTNDDGSTADLYAVRVAQAGACQEVRLTNLNMTSAQTEAYGSNRIQVSTSGLGTEATKNVIAFAEASVLHRVFDDGTALDDAALPDSENNLNFHSIRLNPKFPSVVMYRRNQPGSTESTASLWVVDLKNPVQAYNVLPSGQTGMNEVWSPNGGRVGFVSEGKWYVADVVTDDGTLKLNDTGAFTVTPNGPPDATGLAVSFCNWPPHGEFLACSTNQPGADGKLFLMTLDGTSVNVLTSMGTSAGEVKDNFPLFFGYGLLFQSDVTGQEQVFTVTRSQ